MVEYDSLISHLHDMAPVATVEQGENLLHVRLKDGEGINLSPLFLHFPDLHVSDVQPTEDGIELKIFIGV